MEQRDLDETRVHGRLPNLDIEVVHRRAPGSDAELVTVTVQAVLYPQVFGALLPFVDPFRLWAQAAEAAWSPWLQTFGAFLPPPASVRRPAADAMD